MRIYEHQAPSLLQYYRLHGKLRQVRADRDPGQVFEALCRVIDEHPPTVIETEPVVERAVPLMQGDGAPGKDGVGKTVHVKKAPAQKAALKKARSKAPVSTKKAAVKNKGGAARDEKGQ
ncbi:MAG TPA: hypothetical protein ENK50_03970 [Sedimenticola sp.]|nr:hypothetical protein [Sedimenticola sp.]